MSAVDVSSGVNVGALRNAVARMIDPRAFREWDSLYSLGLFLGDDEQEARRCAERCYGPDRCSALEKADAILSFIATTDLLAALQQAQSVLAMFIEPKAIERTSTQNAYAQAVAAEVRARAALAAAQSQS